MRRILILVGIALVVFLVIVSPDGASSSVKNIGSALYDGASSVTRFFTNLTGSS